MPLLHCVRCHHEWESTDRFSKCSWCDSEGDVLEEKTPLEQMMDTMFGADDFTDNVKNSKSKIGKGQLRHIWRGLRST